MGTPTNQGTTGDFYVDTAANAIYGPKTAGGWSSGTNMVGPQGPKGDTGAAGAAGPLGPKGDTGAAGAAGPLGPKGDTGAQGNPGTAGNTVLNGVGAPTAGQGTVGDFYIDTAANAIYGPKATNGWTSPTSIVGPRGAQGADGAQGPKGDTGAAGGQGPKGDTGDQGPAGLINDTTFNGGTGVSDQPSGQNRAIITATGLSAGTYLVTLRTYIYPAQRYLCGIAQGTLSGSSPIATYRTTNSGGNPETFESTGVMTINQANQSQIFYCDGFANDWSASNPVVDFIKIDTLTQGTTG